MYLHTVLVTDPADMLFFSECALVRKALPKLLKIVLIELDLPLAVTPRNSILYEVTCPSFGIPFVGFFGSTSAIFVRERTV